MELVTSPYVRGLVKPHSLGFLPPFVLRGFECPLLFCAVCHLSYLNCVSGAGSEARKKRLIKYVNCACCTMGHKYLHRRQFLHEIVANNAEKLIFLAFCIVNLRRFNYVYCIPRDSSAAIVAMGVSLLPKSRHIAECINGLRSPDLPTTWPPN